jgi:glycosyltransferase involved in cell wall biosynthesis
LRVGRDERHEGTRVNVAIVHDWLTGMRGGERVLEALLELYPAAEIFTLLHVPGSVSELIEDRPIHTSPLQRVPFAMKRYRYLLPLFPRAVEALDLAGFELVVSSSHCIAKSARVPREIPHLCYCHTPMRYVWDQFDAYFGVGRAGPGVRAAMRALAPGLRSWDVETSARVHRFVASSHHVRDRILRYYGRDAYVVHPPVDLARFHPSADRDDYYVMVGAAAPYKRFDLAVEAFRRLDRRLVVVGRAAGSGAGSRVREGALPPNVEVLGSVRDEEVTGLLSRARALVLPGVEDFGIVVVEALASGTPIVAFGVGGVLDTVRPLGVDEDGRPATGVFFDVPSPESLAHAIARLEAHRFEPADLVAASRGFGKDRFLAEMRAQHDALLASST